MATTTRDGITHVVDALRVVAERPWVCLKVRDRVENGCKGMSGVFVAFEDTWGAASALQDCRLAVELDDEFLRIVQSGMKTLCVGVDGPRRAIVFCHWDCGRVRRLAGLECRAMIGDRRHGRTHAADGVRIAGGDRFAAGGIVSSS